MNYIEEKIGRLEEALEDAGEDLEQANEAGRLALVEQTNAREALAEIKDKVARFKFASKHLNGDTLALAAKAYALAFGLRNDPRFGGQVSSDAFNVAKGLLLLLDPEVGAATHESIVTRSVESEENFGEEVTETLTLPVFSEETWVEKVAETWVEMIDMLGVLYKNATSQEDKQ